MGPESIWKSLIFNLIDESLLSPLKILINFLLLSLSKIKEEDKIKVHEQKINQLEYEASRAFEQYNEVDPRNRLVAAELERRWNEKLEELEDVKKSLANVESERCNISDEEKRKIFALGERFSQAWENQYCSNPLRKKIIRTIIRLFQIDSGPILPWRFEGNQG
jgi:hypothetical protein